MQCALFFNAISFDSLATKNANNVGNNGNLATEENESHHFSQLGFDVIIWVNKLNIQNGFNYVLNCYFFSLQEPHNADHISYTAFMSILNKINGKNP